MNRALLQRQFAVCLLCLWSWPVGGAAEEPFVRVTGQPLYQHSHWGMLFVDLHTGEVLHETNADRLFIPASTTKLFSVAAALDALGSDYRFETPIYRRGDLDDKGTLAGDLILVAGGDLTLGGRTDAQGRIAFKNSDHTYASVGGSSELTEPDPCAGLRELARQVAESGVKAVRGEVLVDLRLFDEASSSGSGPGRVLPLYVNDNVIDFVITPAEEGRPAQVTWRPEGRALQVDAAVDTIQAGEPPYLLLRSLGHQQYVVRGRIPAGRKPLLLVAEVPDPASWARSLLIDQLKAAGIDVEASPLGTHPADRLPDPSAYDPARRVALLRSPPFAEAARLILKVSHNLHASTLPLLVAHRHGRRSLADGLQLQHEFLRRAGVDVEAVSFGGGAGGGRADHATPRATVQLLRHMATRPDFAAYEQALPILGVDGTCAGHVSPDSPVRGKVQAKTGTLYWDNVMNQSSLLTSKALAGYLTTKSNRRLAFALFVNHVPLKNDSQTGKIGEALGQICELAYERW